jgi:malonate decarboxylase alpha subunit
MADWQSERRARDERLAAGRKFAVGKVVAANATTALLEAVMSDPAIASAWKATTRSRRTFSPVALAKADPKVLHDLHVVQSGIVLPEHIDLFEKGIAKKLDFSFSGPQSHAIPRVT